MKHLPFIVLVLLAACKISDPKDMVSIVNKNIRELIQKTAHDPGSYEPIETTILDTIYFSENYSEAMADVDEATKLYEGMIAKLDGDVAQSKREGYYGPMKSMYDEHQSYNREKLAETQARRAVILGIADSVKNSANSNQICAYYILHKCRLKNKMGALNLSEYYVQVNAAGEILTLSEDKDKMLLFPNLDGKAAPILKPGVKK